GVGVARAAARISATRTGGGRAGGGGRGAPGGGVVWGLRFRGTRPAGLEVADGMLGAELAEALADPGLTVRVRADLPAVDRVVREMERAMGETPPLPEALDAPGVTVERIR